jgi:hypothetical protein
MTKVSDQRIKLRIVYAREKDLIFSDDIPKYADWLESELANLITKLEEISNLKYLRLYDTRNFRE